MSEREQELQELYDLLEELLVSALAEWYRFWYTVRGPNPLSTPHQRLFDVLTTIRALIPGEKE